jgi:hypothetical protein
MSDMIKRLLNGVGLICLFRGHLWGGKGKYEGDYCQRCGEWEFER